MSTAKLKSYLRPQTKQLLFWHCKTLQCLFLFSPLTRTLDVVGSDLDFGAQPRSLLSAALSGVLWGSGHLLVPLPQPYSAVSSSAGCRCTGRIFKPTQVLTVNTTHFLRKALRSKLHRAAHLTLHMVKQEKATHTAPQNSTTLTACAGQYLGLCCRS